MEKKKRERSKRGTFRRAGEVMPGVFDLECVSDRLNLDPEWLAEEGKSGRIPCFQAGSKMLFNLRAVEKVVYARMNAMFNAVGVKEYVERARSSDGAKGNG